MVVGELRGKSEIMLGGGDGGVVSSWWHWESGNDEEAMQGGGRGKGGNAWAGRVRMRMK